MGNSVMQHAIALAATMEWKPNIQEARIITAAISKRRVDWLSLLAKIQQLVFDPGTLFYMIPLIQSTTTAAYQQHVSMIGNKKGLEERDG